MGKIISDYKKIDKYDWNKFVLNHQDGNIFQTPEMYYALLNTKFYKPIIICVQESNINVGILLACIQKEYNGVLGYFTSRCIVFGGPLALDNSFQIQKELINALEKEIQKLVLFTQFRFFKPMSEELKSFLLSKKYSYEPHLNIIVDTSIGIDNLWKQIKRNRKDGINKGKKQGFEFIVGSKNISTFYELLKLTYKKVNKPFPKYDFFNSLKNEIKNDNLLLFELAYNKTTCISLLAFCYKRTLYAFYIGINDEKDFLNLRPVDYFYWEVIKWCSEHEVNYFDWMGAGNKNQDYGVRDFKLQYGGVLFEPGRMSKFNNIIIEIFFKRILKIWQKVNKLRNINFDKKRI